MLSDWVLVLYYTKSNRYSFNALIGALETDRAFDELDVRFARDEEKVFSVLTEANSLRKRVVVAISFATPQLWDTARMVSRVRNEFGKGPLLLGGGPHPTGDPHGTLSLGFDVCARGEGEETFPELLKVLGADGDYATVKGIAYLQGGQIYCSTGIRKPVDLDFYPPFPVAHGKFGPIEITRGCPFACGYCQTAHLFGTKPRHRSIETVVKYVEAMKARNLDDIRVITPNAFSYGSLDGRTVNMDALTGLLSALRRTIGDEGRIFFGSFPSEVRPEHVTRETIALVTQYANNDNLVVGAQSGSQRLLNGCNRGHTVDDIVRAVELILGAGLKANVDFIFGLPGENDDDAEQSLVVIERLARMGARIHTHTFMPLPQTKFERCRPGRVGKRTLSVLKRLVSSGCAYGEWRQQEQEAVRIARYLKTGQL